MRRKSRITDGSSIDQQDSLFNDLRVQFERSIKEFEIALEQVTHGFQRMVTAYPQMYATFKDDTSSYWDNASIKTYTDEAADLCISLILDGSNKRIFEIFFNTLSEILQGVSALRENHTVRAEGLSSHFPEVIELIRISSQKCEKLLQDYGILIDETTLKCDNVEVQVRGPKGWRNLTCAFAVRLKVPYSIVTTKDYLDQLMRNLVYYTNILKEITHLG
ncbi:MAG: hypothetical protein JW779_14105 [Candidatus Thorarchaeota archaeon]|nr:hypothetical protein [Candidatus Thorarchaeota archaeon]